MGISVSDFCSSAPALEKRLFQCAFVPKQLLNMYIKTGGLFAQRRRPV